MLPGDLVRERRPLRAPGPGEVVLRNAGTSVAAFERGSPGAPASFITVSPMSA